MNVVVPTSVFELDSHYHRSESIPYLFSGNAAIKCGNKNYEPVLWIKKKRSKD